MRVTQRAGSEDLDEVLALAELFCHLGQRFFDRDRVEKGLRPLLADDSLGRVWLVDSPEHPGERCGYGVVTWGWSVAAGGRVCMLDELHLRGHGNGLAVLALVEILHEIEAAGAARVVLETEAHDRKTRQFFGAAGFDLTDSVWMSTALGASGPLRP